MFNRTLVINSMNAEFGAPVRYYLDGFNMNFLIGKRLIIQVEGYECVNCKRRTKIFRQGLCEVCFFKSPARAQWVLKPELSKAHLGIEDNDLEFEKKIQLQPYCVYLMNNSNIIVGMAQKSNLPTTWINRGADESIVFLEAPNRYLAGIAESVLRNNFSDKVNWRSMLLGRGDKNLDLGIYYDKCIEIINSDSELKRLLRPHIIQRKNAIEKSLLINYPINYSRIRKVQSLGIEKMKIYRGILTGIKGQYLIFNNNEVLNIRTNAGLVLNISTS